MRSGAATNRAWGWLQTIWSDWHLLHPSAADKVDSPMPIATKGLA